MEFAEIEELSGQFLDSDKDIMGESDEAVMDESPRKKEQGLKENIQSKQRGRRNNSKTSFTYGLAVGLGIGGISSFFIVWAIAFSSVPCFPLSIL